MRKESIRSCVKLYLITAAFCSSVIISHGQKMDMEILVGPNLGYVKGFEILTDFKTGLTTGLGFNYYFNDKFSVGLKFLYEEKGSQGEIIAAYSLDPLLGRIDIKAKLRSDYQYLTLPLSTKFTIGNKVRYYFEFGTFASHLVKSQFVSGGLGTNPDNILDATNLHKKFDFGLSFAMGTKLSISNRFHLNLMLLNNLGLIDIRDGSSASNFPLRTNSFGVLAGGTYQIK